MGEMLGEDAGKERGNERKGQTKRRNGRMGQLPGFPMVPPHSVAYMTGAIECKGDGERVKERKCSVEYSTD